MSVETTTKRFQFLGLPLDALTNEETLDWIEQAIQNRTPTQHTVINAAKVVNSKNDPFLKQSILESDLVNVDGQAVVWAAKVLGIPVPERVAGIDLMSSLLEKAENRGWSIYFLGAKQNILDELVQRVKNQYPRINIVGSRNGYFNSEQAEQVAKEIQVASPDILFVGMPTPQKEVFIHKYLKQMNVPFCMGVGGSFDVLSGKTKRAPVWMQKAGLEWFFRLSQEPRRLFARYASTNLRFILMVCREKANPKHS